MHIELSEHFTYGKLLKFTFPSIIMMVFTSIYGVVDGFFISNFAGAEPFAAINIVMPFLMIFGAVGFMFGTGGSALVAYLLGVGDHKKANETFSLMVYLLIGIGAVLMVIGLIFLEPICKLLGATAEMMPYCLQYGRIILWSLVPFMLQYIFQSFLVTAERPNLGLYVTIMAGGVDMVLDALLVGVCKLGVVGAAEATAASQCVGGLIPLLYFSMRNKSKLRLGKTHMDFSLVVKACTNGASEFMTNISMSIVNMLYNWQLMRLLGTNGVAAYGVIMYVNFIFLSIFIGYSMGSAPIVGFHYGAGNKDELKGLLRKSLRIITVMEIVLTLAAVLLARPLSLIFVSYDKELLAMTITAFTIYAFSFLGAGYSIYISSFFTALNNGAVSAGVSFGRTLIFQVISVLLLPAIFGPSGIWYAVIMAEAMALVLSFGCLFYNKKKYGYM
mgnify:CR=1 FL=1